MGEETPSPLSVAAAVQKYNAVIVNLHENKICSATLKDDSEAIDAAASVLGAWTKEIETDCIVVITVNLENLMRVSKLSLRKETKTWFSVSSGEELLSTSAAFLARVEAALDRAWVDKCSSCNNQNPSSSEATTEKGDQPLNKKSGRWISLHDEWLIQQDGVFYGSYFVPCRKGKLLRWFSSPPAPKQLSARLCCLLNFINFFGNTGVVQDFTAYVYKEELGTETALLEMKLLRELDDVLVVVQL